MPTVKKKGAPVSRAVVRKPPGKAQSPKNSSAPRKPRTLKPTPMPELSGVMLEKPVRLLAAARYLGCGKQALRRTCDQLGIELVGRPRGAKGGHDWLIAQPDFRRLLEHCGISLPPAA
jgi:hypothetical protein